MARRVVIEWTATAKSQLAELPPKVRKGILSKADALQSCTDPKTAHKPLVGPLEGYYRLTYARYRAVYSVKEDKLPSGDSLVFIRIQFVAVGKREEHARDDIYKIAEKMVNLGIIKLPETNPDD